MAAIKQWKVFDDTPVRDKARHTGAIFKREERYEMSIISNIKEKKSMYYTDEDAPSLVTFLLSFVLVHTAFMIGFYIAGVKEMFVYNILSVSFFLALIIWLFTQEHANYSVIDVLISFEVALHQVLAIHFVGLDAGFQYLLLGLATPIIYYSLKHIFTIITIVKAVLSMGIFLLCNYLYKYQLTPVYQINDERWLTWTYYICTLCLYVTVAKGTIESYTKYKGKLVKEYQFHKDAIEKQLSMQQNVIQTIADMVEARDETTGLHTARTKEHVHQILRKLKEYDKYKDQLTDEYIKDVEAGAVLHDIGKIKIPDAILNKPGRLTDEEYAIIKTHTVEGANLLRVCHKSLDNEAYYEIAQNIALYHHERWDGKGYPHNLSKEAIPLEARIMAVADVYDALMSKRPYKEPFSKEVAIKIMQDGRGTQFDPDVFDCFLAYITKIA